MNDHQSTPTPITYYKNGNIKLERVDVDNQKYYYNEYYEDKKLKSVTPFFMNLPCGVQKEYYQSGHLRSEIDFFMGKQMGTKKRYFKSGILKRQQRQSTAISVLE